MSARLTLPVPASVTTRFLVATGESAAPDAAYLRDALGRTGLARTARALLGSPLLTVDGGRDVPTRWSDRLHSLGGAAEDLERVRGATRHIVLTSVAAPAAQPRHAQAARLAARTLAAATGGVTVDLDTGQMVTRDRGSPAEPERFILGQEWVGVFLSLEAGPPGAAGAPGGTRVRAETAGLHRFGLPEVVVRDVPYGHMLTAANLLRGLSYRLFAEQREWLGAGRKAGERDVLACRILDGDDVLRFWGARPDGAGAVPLRLVRGAAECPGCAVAVEARPPRDDRGWWDEWVGPALPALARADPAPGPSG